MTAQVVGALDDIPIGEGRAFAVDQEQIAVYRLRDGSLRAISAVCPHKGGPLADGLTDESVVICPLHGNTYDLATGAQVGGSYSVCTYPVSTGPDGSIMLDGQPNSKP